MFTLGIDYGTNSVRALVVRCSDGAELGSCVVDYPSGAQGVLLDPKDDHLARQHPGDYLFGLEESVRARSPRRQASAASVPPKSSASASTPPGRVRSPSTRQTGPSRSTSHGGTISPPSAGSGRTTRAGARPRGSPSSPPSTARSTSPSAATSIPPNGSGPRSGIASNVAPEMFDAAYSWVELADWVPVRPRRRRPIRPRSSAASAPPATRRSTRDEWGGLPDKEFLARSTRSSPTCATGSMRRPTTRPSPPGSLCPEWAAKLGLPAGIPIAIGEFDVHYGAIGCGVSEGTLVKVIGTSTCDCAVVSADKQVADIPGICGIVKGAILPGYYGIEAGQSAVGDIFKWWVEGVCGGDAALHAQLDRRGGAAEARPGRPARARLEQRQPHHPRRPTAVRPAARPGPLHDPRRDLPRADRGDGLRRARHHRAHSGIRRAASTGWSAPAASRRRTRC